MRQLPVTGTRTSDPVSPLMRPVEAAAALGLTAAELRALRQRGGGPVFYRIGWRTIRYSRADIDRRRGALLRTGTSDPARD